MINITLPDGSKKPFDHPVTVAEVAASIGAGLAKATARRQGRRQARRRERSHRSRRDACDRHGEGSPKALEIIRHSTAHLLGQAVQAAVSDARRWSIGPVIDDGFYYDFAYERPFTPDDLAAIEAAMRELIDKDYDVVKQRDAARRSHRRLQEARRGLQAAPHRGHARREADGPVLPRGIRRHVPRPARAEHAFPARRSS